MRFKKLIIGALAVMIATGSLAAQVSAAGEKKTTDYQAYAKELDKYAYNGSDLGATYTEKATTFKVWSPKASSVTVEIFEKGSEAEAAAAMWCGTPSPVRARTRA